MIEKLLAMRLHGMAESLKTQEQEPAARELSFLERLLYLPRKTLQESNKRALLLRLEVTRPDFRVEIRVGTTALGVELYNILQRREAAVVHVGSGAGYLAKGGRLEVALARAGVRELPIAPGNPSIVELLVGEVRADVAGSAVSFPAEDLESLPAAGS